MVQVLVGIGSDMAPQFDYTAFLKAFCHKSLHPPLEPKVELSLAANQASTFATQKSPNIQTPQVWVQA